MDRNKQITSGRQYPFPAIPEKWSRDEAQFALGLRAIFDILFSRKIQDVLLADGSVTSRVLAKKAVALSHLVDGFGDDLDISGNDAISGLSGSVGEVESALDTLGGTVSGLPDQLYPVGIIIIADAVPVSFGTWAEIDIGITGAKAWKRTA